MRLTLSTLPQLAVLANILCLLIVIMCEAVSAMSSLSIVSGCGAGNITVKGRMVKAIDSNIPSNYHYAPFQKLITKSEDFSGKLYIFAEMSKRYICFNKHWNIVGLSKVRNDLKSYCQFYEFYDDSERYYMYRSVMNRTRYLGFSRATGKPIRKPILTNSTEVSKKKSKQNSTDDDKKPRRFMCFNFMKYDPKADISRHNYLVKAERSSINRDSYASAKAPSRRSTPNNNTLLQDNSARKSDVAPHHYRHSNHRKLVSRRQRQYINHRQRQYINRRQRQYINRRPIEANKY